MSPYRSPALLASAALVLGAALVPATAFADDPGAVSTPSAFTNADLVAALTAAQAPTAAAAARGWVAQGTSAESGSPATRVKTIDAVDRGRTDDGDGDTIVEAQHAGMYITVSSLGGRARVRRALKAIGKPHATWIFEAHKSLDLHTRGTGSIVAEVSGSAILGEIIDPTQTTLTGTPTKTVAPDGSTTYSFSDIDLTMNNASGTGTVTLNAGGVVTAATNVTATESDNLNYTYGVQHVDLPAKKKTVTLRQFGLGSVLAALPQQVKASATLVAHLATSNAHRQSVKVDGIRSYAKKLTTQVDRGLGRRIFTTKAVTGGAEITGTNPFTHAHVTYAVTAAGKKAVVHKR